MNHAIRPALAADAPIMRPMLLAYQKYIGQFSDSVDADRELEDVWFEKPGQLFPFLISSEGQSVGLLLLMGKVYAEACGVQAEHYLYDLYVTPNVRGKGVAAQAVSEVLGQFRGSWQVDVLDQNKAAQSFWRMNLPLLVSDLKIEGPVDKLWNFRFST